MTIANILMSESREVSLAESAYRAVRTAILSRQLAVGEPLREEALAQQLGMSRTPIREALGRLRVEGLVREARPRGYVVSGVMAQDVFDVYAIREELEGLCHRLAATRITPHQIFMLTTITDRMEQSLDDPPRFSSLNRDFHRVVVDAAGNPVLTKVMDDLMAIVDRYPVSAYCVEGRTGEALDEHRAILEALARKDPQAAEQAVQHHLRVGLQARLEALRRHELGLVNDEKFERRVAD